MMHHDHGVVSFRRRKMVPTILCLSFCFPFLLPCTNGFHLPPEPQRTVHSSLHLSGATQRMELMRRSLLRQHQSTDLLEIEVLNPKKESPIVTLDVSISEVAPSTPIEDNYTDDKKGVWTVMGLLWLIAAISALDRVAMSVALIPMASEFHFTDTTSGAISSLFSVGYGLAILPAGLLVSCISPKQVLGCGVAVWSLATWLTPSCAALLPIVALPILLIRSVVGMGEAMVIPTIHRLLSVWTSPQQKSSAIAFIYSGFHAGTIGAYLLSPLILDTLGDWRSLFYAFGSLGLILLVPWLLWAQDAPPVTNKSIPLTLGSSNLPPPVDSAPSAATLSWGDALRSYQNAPWMGFLQSKGAWGMLLAHCAKNWGLYTSLSWTPTFYAEQYGIGVHDSAWLSVLPSVAGAAGGFCAGALADATLRSVKPTEDATRTYVRKIFQAVGLLGPAVALGSLAYSVPEHAWVAQLYLMAAVGLQSFNAGGFEAGTQDKAGPKWSGMLYSVTSLPSVMVGTYGVYVTGLVLDLSHQNWSLVWYINAAVNVVGALAFISLYDSKREFD